MGVVSSGPILARETKVQYNNLLESLQDLCKIRTKETLEDLWPKTKHKRKTRKIGVFKSSQDQ